MKTQFIQNTINNYTRQQNNKCNAGVNVKVIFMDAF